MLWHFIVDIQQMAWLSHLLDWQKSDKRQIVSNLPCHVVVVEPRRIELLSESKSANLSTRLVYLLKFPHSTPTNRIADTVALWCVNSYKALAENVGCWSTP